jgi:hypothetical protein
LGRPGDVGADGKHASQEWGQDEQDEQDGRAAWEMNLHHLLKAVFSRQSILFILSVSFQRFNRKFWV